MGRTVSHCHQVLAGQLGKAYGILPIYGWHQKTYLYHQYSGRVSSSDSQGNKNKGVFPSDTALEKLVYLAYRNIRNKWTMPLANWATMSQQLAIKFRDRFKLF